MDLKRKSRSNKFPLTRVMAKLAITSEAVVTVSFLAMNLEKILAGIISIFVFILAVDAGASDAGSFWAAEVDAGHSLGNRMRPPPL